MIMNYKGIVWIATMLVMINRASVRPDSIYIAEITKIADQVLNEYNKRFSS